VAAKLGNHQEGNSEELFPNIGRGLLDRQNLARRWHNHDAAKIEQLLDRKCYPPKLRQLFQLQQAALRKHIAKLEYLFQQAVQARDRLIPVLRDVQPGHVIFAGSQVTGFIDLTAARVDSVMSDLARLLSRWRFAEPEWYAAAVAAYQKVRPLENDELVVLDAYDFTARLLTGVQWLCWVVLEEREFTNQMLVEQHWERIERDLKNLLDSQYSAAAKSPALLL
jgi:Ser/Thr protein kinase RdoA (MazF antagonist)